MESLIIFRGVQGVGAGAIFPVSLAIIGDLFTPRERGRYQGLFGAVFGVAAVIGPLLGGWLTDNLSWHWIFLVNLPIGAVTLFIVGRLPALGPRRAADTQPRLPGRGRLRGRRRLPARGPDQQADGRMGMSRGRWLPARRGAAGRRLPVHRVASGGAHRAAGALPQPQLRGHHHGHVPGLHRASSAPSSSCPAGSSSCAGRQPDASQGSEILPLLAGVILSSIVSGILVSRTGKFRWIVVGRAGRHVRGPAALHEPARAHRPARHVGVDVRHRPGRRAHAVGLHDRRPGLGALQPPRRGHRQPDLLPPGRRLGRPGHRGHVFAESFAHGCSPASLEAPGFPPAGRPRWRPCSPSRRRRHHAGGRRQPGRPARRGAAARRASSTRSWSASTRPSRWPSRTRSGWASSSRSLALVVVDRRPARRAALRRSSAP